MHSASIFLDGSFLKISKLGWPVRFPMLWLEKLLLHGEHLPATRSTYRHTQSVNIVNSHTCDPVWYPDSYVENYESLVFDFLILLEPITWKFDL